MEGNLIKLEQGKIIEDIGNVAITFHAPDHSESVPIHRIYPLLILKQDFITVQCFNLRTCYVSCDAAEPLLVHILRRPHVKITGEHSFALQFTSSQRANDFLDILHYHLDNKDERQEVLNDQGGPGTTNKLTVHPNIEHRATGSSFNSHSSEFSHSVSSSGYYSGTHWSEVSGYTQIYSNQDNNLELTRKPSSADKAGESSTPVNRSSKPEVKEERLLRCKYCNKQFEDERASDQLCPYAPNKPRETLDRLCCVGCYKGAWYHLTKDTLDDEGQDIGRCSLSNGMTPGYWCLLGIVSVVCAPCLILWCPLSVCELATQQLGITGGPHSLAQVKKKTTMLPSRKVAEEGTPVSDAIETLKESTDENQDGVIRLQPLDVKVSSPPDEAIPSSSSEEDYFGSDDESEEDVL